MSLVVSVPKVVVRLHSKSLKLLSNDGQTAKRKVQEWYLSYKLEQQYSKHEILEMYLNKINLGNRSYGIATAAQKYYGKDLKDLQLHEAAMLAGLPQGQTFMIQQKGKC